MMAIYANPKKNEVCVDWLKPHQKCAKYFKKVGKRRLSFIGSEDTKKDAEEIKKFRKDKYDRQTKIVKLGKAYLLYSH